MKFQPETFVKLNPSFIGSDSAESPIWGGREGFLGGTVRTVFTHAHKKDDHEALVEWYNGRSGKFREEALLNLTDTESEFSKEWIKCSGAIPNDVFILLRMASGKFVLNAVESRASFDDASVPLGQPRYSFMMTKFALPELVMTDHAMVERMMAFPDYVEKTYTTLHAALQAFFVAWGVDVPRAIYFPLPTFEFLSDAMSKAPDSSSVGSYSMFHLNKNLCDYSVESPS